MKWEYKIMEVRRVGLVSPRIRDVKAEERQMNQLGDEGWELVRAITLHESFGQTYKLYLFFKRPKE